MNIWFGARVCVSLWRMSPSQSHPTPRWQAQTLATQHLERPISAKPVRHFRVTFGMVRTQWVDSEPLRLQRKTFTVYGGLCARTHPAHRLHIGAHHATIPHPQNGRTILLRRSGVTKPPPADSDAPPPSPNRADTLTRNADYLTDATAGQEVTRCPAPGMLSVGPEPTIPHPMGSSKDVRPLSLA